MFLTSLNLVQTMKGNGLNCSIMSSFGQRPSSWRQLSFSQALAGPRPSQEQPEMLWTKVQAQNTLQASQNRSR
jgi:hypothetical protein